VIRTEALSKVYRMGDVRVEALRAVDLHIAAGEFVAVVGPSGSGKSTLMNIIGCLDVPTAGRYWLNGREVSRLNDNQLAAVRNRQIGFVFQSFNLMPRLTAFDNVVRPLIFRGMGPRERAERARRALERVGLADRMQHRPTQLSGGQQQRVAVARAIAGDPAIILADEPTGNLDTASGLEVMALLRELHGQGKTMVLITHNPEAARQAERRIMIKDGRVTAEEGGAT
jgi:putative ABC transport system ATP-binding protein